MSDPETTSPDQQAAEARARDACSSGIPRVEPTRYYFALFQSGLREDPLGSLNRRVLHHVQRLLDNTIETPRDETVIDVWLESPGGDANVAYKLSLVLRSRSHALRVVVPDYAKSAATLLAIGADRICMGAAAELGPLDVQIEHPDREGRMISGLDVADALGFLAGFASDYTITAGYDILQFTELPRALVLRELTRFSALLLKPVVDKLDPHLIHKAANELNIAKKYAELLLDGRNLAEQDKENGPRSAKLAEHLVKDYPAHDFVISRDEASSLGLPVAEAEHYDRWTPVHTLHQQYREGLFSNQGPPSVIRVWSESDIAQLCQRRPQENHRNAFASAGSAIENCEPRMEGDCDATE